jgi:heme o synthase
MADTSNYSPALRRPLPASYLALLKPRVMSLVIFTALVGIFAAPAAVDPVAGLLSLLFIATGAGASGALNMWWDADIDLQMRRTRNRPIPNGDVSPRATLVFGLVLSVLSVFALWIVSNALAAGLLAFTIFFYVVIYSMILKRRTPQNIVIGGAAGAFPPMIGWAVATGSIGIESVMLFGLIFFWTPPHFWALALYMHDDYSRAGVPMLTVTHGRTTTRRHVLIYSVVLAVISIAIGFSAIGGPVYLIAAVGLNLMLLRRALAIASRDETTAAEDRYATERAFFRLTLLYLFVLFAAVWLEAALNAIGL